MNMRNLPKRERMKKQFGFIFLFLIPLLVFPVTPEIQKNEKTEKRVLPRTYRSVELLDTLEKAAEKLKSDTLILTNIDSDFGLMDEEDSNLIKAKIPPYLENVYYQFYEKKLFAIALFFDKKRFTYLELYKEMKKKYGKPSFYNAENAVWQDEKTLMILDNLPSVKYMDKELFSKTIEKDKNNIQLKDRIKEKILEDL